MTGEGAVCGDDFVMPALSRATINPRDDMGDTDFSTHVEGTVGIIAERVMYWDNRTGKACHDSVAMDEPHTPPSTSRTGTQKEDMNLHPHSQPQSGRRDRLDNLPHPIGRGERHQDGDHPRRIPRDLQPPGTLGDPGKDGRHHNQRHTREGNPGGEGHVLERPWCGYLHHRRLRGLTVRQLGASSSGICKYS